MGPYEITKIYPNGSVLLRNQHDNKEMKTNLKFLKPCHSKANSTSHDTLYSMSLSNVNNGITPNDAIRIYTAMQRRHQSNELNTINRKIIHVEKFTKDPNDYGKQLRLKEDKIQKVIGRLNNILSNVVA